MPNDQSAPAPSDAYSLDSVTNALQTMLFMRGRAGVRVTEVAGHLGVAPSTAHRLLATLRANGFVEQSVGSRAYRLAPLVATFSAGFVDRSRIIRIARPALAQLSRESGETANLLALDGSDIRFLDGVESTLTLRVAPRTGDVLPAHGTAGGKAILSAMNPEDVRALFAGSLPALTSETITDADLLEADLAAVRARGYATNFGESVGEVGAVGVPIVDGSGQCVAAFTVSGPLSRVSTATADALHPLLRAAADHVAAQL